MRPDPHAIIEIERPGMTDGQALVRWDSWASPRLIESIDVDLVTNESSMVEWRVFDPEFRVIDGFAGSSPVPQSTIRVYLGYGANPGTPVFKGLLADVSRDESSTTFTAFDMAFKMKLLKRAGITSKKDDVAIMAQLASRNGLQFEGPDEALNLEPHNSMMQDESTDWDHLLERARDAGLIVFVRGDTVFAKPPAKPGAAVMVLKHKKDFVLRRGWDFRFSTPESLDGRPRVVKHVGRGKGGKRAEGESATSDRGREDLSLKRSVPGAVSKSKLSRRARAQKELDREHAFQGRIEAALTPTVRRPDVRETVRVEGVGRLFSGKYVIDRLAFRFAPGRLGMELDMYRDA